MSDLESASESDFGARGCPFSSNTYGTRAAPDKRKKKQMKKKSKKTKKSKKVKGVRKTHRKSGSRGIAHLKQYQYVSRSLIPGWKKKRPPTFLDLKEARRRKRDGKPSKKSKSGKKLTKKSKSGKKPKSGKKQSKKKSTKKAKRTGGKK